MSSAEEKTPSVSATTEKSCNLCQGQPASGPLKKCTACKSVFYCSKECVCPLSSLQINLKLLIYDETPHFDSTISLSLYRSNFISVLLLNICI